MNQAVLPSFAAQSLLTELKTAPFPLPVLRTLLRRLQDESFHYFRATLDATSLIHLRAKHMSELLACLWRYFELPEQDFCLLAVGGFGRGELHPYSDIDVLLLAKDEALLEREQEKLQRFITLLWDLKLEVGHSVRTLEDSAVRASDDLTIITNLLENRLLIGDAQLQQQLFAQISPAHIWPVSSYFHAKWQELRERHQKHNDSEYNLEPNVKNSPGALRDIQTINWICLRAFGSRSLETLLAHQFLSAGEYERLTRDQSFLWQVRYALHMLAGREEDRLLFELQRQVAALLGFKDSKKQLGVELFMSRFYRHQLATIELCDLLLLHFNENFLPQQSSRITPINEHFQLVDGFLQLRDLTLFAREPGWLLRIFLLMAHTKDVKGVHSQTIRALRKHRHLITHEFRQNKNHNAIFIELIQSPKWVVRELKRMMRYGILGRYIPEFGRIIGMMEHDLFHIYTVDEHSLRMMRLLRKLRIENLPQFALATDIASRFKKKEVLYLTALLHDTGKSLIGEHMANSGKIARKFCRQHQLNEADSTLIVWLCEQHLLMSKASQRLELNNPDDIFVFAQKVENITQLNYLYLISVSDIYSTNPKHWTSWRAEQINTLYRHTLKALERGLDNPLSSEEHIEQTQARALLELQQKGIDESTARAIWGSANADYFIRESVADIVWHTEMIFQHGDNSEPLVAIRPTSTQAYEGATQIFIFMKDQINLFAATTATLDQLNLNIQDARIMTSEIERNVVDTYVVLDEYNQPITHADRLSQIQTTLKNALATPENYSTIIKRRTPRALKQFKVETQVQMSTDTFLNCTKVEVIAADRPGLLARMGAIFARFGAQIQAAKILTEGERVADIFYLLNAQGLPYTDAQACQTLKEAIITGLDEQVAAQSSV